jgi:hypothetical protein
VLIYLLVILDQGHFLQQLRKEMKYRSVMMPMINALLLDILVATICKEEVKHSPTMMSMMNAINFC